MVIMDVLTMVEVKVMKIGNSLGIVLPREVLTHLGVEKGDQLKLAMQPGRLLVTALDPDFEKAMEVAREVMNRNKNALAELAK